MIEDADRLWESLETRPCGGSSERWSVCGVESCGRGRIFIDGLSKAQADAIADSYNSSRIAIDIVTIAEDAVRDLQELNAALVLLEHVTVVTILGAIRAALNYPWQQARAAREKSNDKHRRAVAEGAD